jgi:hypothetical protein
MPVQYRHVVPVPPGTRTTGIRFSKCAVIRHHGTKSREVIWGGRIGAAINAEQTPVELIELGTELVRAGYQAGSPLKRNTVALCRMDDRPSHLDGIEPLVSHDLKDALSGQFLDHSLSHLHQAGCLSSLISHDDQCPS